MGTRSVVLTIAAVGLWGHRTSGFIRRSIDDLGGLAADVADGSREVAATPISGLTSPSSRISLILFFKASRRLS